MKRSILWIMVVLVADLAGCSSSSQPNSSPGTFDPVVQVAPLSTAYQDESGQKFDVGVAFFRNEEPTGSPSLSDVPLARMAFQLNGNPAKVSNATVNGSTLSWVADYSPWSSPDTYVKDSAVVGSVDSFAFSYQNFDGESFSSDATIASYFGSIIQPDTVSIALGCTVKFEHSSPRDSVVVSIVSGGNDTLPSIRWTIPDTGGFIIQPHQLSFLPNESYHLYIVNIYRAHWESIVSPMGKRIGVYSTDEVDYSFSVTP